MLKCVWILIIKLIDFVDDIVVFFTSTCQYVFLFIFLVYLQLAGCQVACRVSSNTATSSLDTSPPRLPAHLPPPTVAGWGLVTWPPPRWSGKTAPSSPPDDLIYVLLVHGDSGWREVSQVRVGPMYIVLIVCGYNLQVIVCFGGNWEGNECSKVCHGWNKRVWCCSWRVSVSRHLLEETEALQSFTSNRSTFQSIF